MSESSSKSGGIVWILVDHSSREASFEGVSKLLKQENVDVHIVTMSEVVGSGLREALSGGAERLLRGIRVAMRGRNQDEDLVGAIKRAKPDLLAVTSPRHVRALGLLESVSGIVSLQVGVFPDYGYDPSWTRSSVQAFIVPHERFADRLSSEGISRSRILVAGPAIQARFARELDRDAERESLSLANTRTVLVRAETLDSHLLEKLVFQGTLVDADVRFVFHHNGDGAVANTLRRAAAQYGLKAAMFGKVDDLERYVIAADAVVASPSDPFIPEILAHDRPLMLVGKAEAEAQVEFLTSIGAARWVEDVLRLGSEIDQLLEPESLSALSEAAAELSQTTGADDVAKALLEALERREEWQQPATTAPDDEPKDAPSGGDDEAPEEEPDDSPFESIGDSSGPSKSGGDTPTYTGISKAEAKDQLASLILTEREIEKKVAETEKQQARWRSRLEMAREWNEDDLATEAESILRGYMDEFDQLQEERRSIQRQKDKLKEAALGGKSGGGQSEGAQSETRLADIEKRFRKMEVDNDLDDLKDRIRRELGD